MSGIGFGKNIIEKLSSDLTVQLEKLGVKDAGKAAEKAVENTVSNLTKSEEIALSKELMKKGALTESIKLTEPVSGADRVAILKGLENEGNEKVNSLIKDAISEGNASAKYEGLRNVQAELFEQFDFGMPGKDVINAFFETNSRVGLSENTQKNVIDTILSKLQNNPGREVSTSEMAQTLIELNKAGKIQDHELFHMVNDLANETMKSLDTGGAGIIEENAINRINESLGQNTPDVNGWIASSQNITNTLKEVESDLARFSSESASGADRAVLLEELEKASEPFSGADRAALLEELEKAAKPSEETLLDVSMKIEEGFRLSTFNGTFSSQENIIRDISNTMEIASFDAVIKSMDKLSKETKKELYHKLFRIHSLDKPSNSVNNMVEMSKAMRGLGETSSIHEHYLLQRNLAKESISDLSASGEGSVAVDALQNALRNAEHANDWMQAADIIHNAFLDIERFLMP